jgi:hypothetical protein
MAGYRNALCVSLAVAAAGWASLFEVRAQDMVRAPAESWQEHRLGPKPGISVMWVGHSLIEQKADSAWGRVDIMSVVGRLAESRKLAYTMTDHTLFGSPLSALWRGRPHSYDRDASPMAEKRAVFETEAGRYDTLVATEAVPLAGTLKYEFSPYYLRSFYCTLLKANPKARVYLYQTWVNFQGSHRAGGKPAPEGFDWRAEMKAERVLWDELADAARKPSVVAPHWLHRLGWTSTSDAGCGIEDPIYSVPVGDALLALDARMAAPKPGDRFEWPDGRPFRLIDMVANPVVDSATGALRDPSKPFDDIHASLAGIYFSALVHFATLYRQSPADLPSPPEIGEPLARTLQCIAWETVAKNPRSGVLGDADC